MERQEKVKLTLVAESNDEQVEGIKDFPIFANQLDEIRNITNYDIKDDNDNKSFSEVQKDENANISISVDNNAGNLKKPSIAEKIKQRLELKKSNMKDNEMTQATPFNQDIPKESTGNFLKIPPAKKPHVTAEELAAISQAASSDRWIVFNAEDEDLASWLNTNKPSATRRSDGVGWIAAMVDESIKEKKNSCSVQLKAAWDSVAANTDQINIHTVTNMAKKFGVTGGKWIFHVTTDRVDVVWERVAKALLEGKLGPNVTQAKVSPVFDTMDGEVTGMGAHVISVYNKDFTNNQEVLQVETSLRQAKLRCMFQYKPEIFSILGIFRNNLWGLRPTIYHAQYHLKKGKSIVETAFDNTWFWNETEGFGGGNKEIYNKETVSDKIGSGVGVQDVVKVETKTKEVGDCVRKDDKNAKTVVLNEITKNVGEEQTSRTENKITEDPGIKLLMGLGISFDIPEDKNERKPVALVEHSIESIASSTTKNEFNKDYESHGDETTGDQSIEGLKSKVMTWLNQKGDGDKFLTFTKQGKLDEAKENPNAKAEETECSNTNIEISHKKCNSPKKRSDKVTNVSDNDADDESTPMKDDKKEKADHNKPSWLKNLQAKFTKKN